MAGRPPKTVLDLCLDEQDEPRRPLEPAEAAESLARELWRCVRDREAGSELNAVAYTELFVAKVKAALDAEIAKTGAVCATLEQTLSRLHLAVRRLSAIRSLARRTPENPAAVIEAAREIKLTDLRMSSK